MHEYFLTVSGHVITRCWANSSEEALVHFRERFGSKLSAKLVMESPLFNE